MQRIPALFLGRTFSTLPLGGGGLLGGNPISFSSSICESHRRWFSSRRGEDRQPLKLEIGDKVHGFRVFSKEYIPERNLTAFRLLHDATGAEHLHLDAPDTNNVFAVTFKTTPRDSTGVAHILEHTVLCGSKKYPVRDPFFNMLKRSLNTYMNAWTAADYTMYPFSTQNEKDYRNLLSVYLDATLFPKLEELDFKQEGHRVEFAQPNDPSSPLQIKGVVFNEMKGVMSDASSTFHHILQSHLFPSSTYHHNSGGEPLEIPKLTYEQLKSFHSTHYHPSNSRFFTYGDLPLADHLKMIHEEGLQHFQCINPDTEVGDEVRYREEQRFKGTCPPLPGADPARQTTISVAFLLNNITDIHDTHTLAILSTLLLSGPNSPFYKALIASHLGMDFAPGTGYNANTREAFFSIGLVGVKKEDIPKVERAIEDTLKEVVSDSDSTGLEADNVRIQSILHQIELSSKHVTSKTGLKLGSAIQSAWIHGANPIEVLKINSLVENFKEELKKNPRFLKDKVKHYLLENKHKIYVTVEADPNYGNEQNEKEQQLVNELVTQLTTEKKKKIVSDTDELKRRQEEQQDLSLLPTVSIHDILKKTYEVPFEKDNFRQVPVFQFPQPTNRMVYYSSISTVSLPDELSTWIPFFCSAVTSMGAAGKNPRQLSSDIEASTGGISAAPFVAMSPHNAKDFEEGVSFSSWCLERNVDKMLALLHDILTTPDFTEKECLRALISRTAQGLQESLTYSGHQVALVHAASTLGRPQFLSELWGGISQLVFMQQLSQGGDETLDHVAQKLKEIASIILQAPKRCSVVAEKDQLPSVTKSVRNFLSDLNVPSNSSSPFSFPSFSSSTGMRKFISIPASVNFVAQVIPTSTHYTSPDLSRLHILSQILSTCFLHKEIREKGGAYGGGASVRENSFSFYSYRDPQLSSTLDSFRGSIDWLLSSSSSFTEEDIQQAKLSVFADLDEPLSPSNKGNALFRYGITDEMRQTRRDILLSIKRSDILEVAQRYLLPLSSATSSSCSNVVVLGSQEQATQLKDAKPAWDFLELGGEEH